MSKIKKLVYSLAVMIFVVVAFSSCDKSDACLEERNLLLYFL